MAKFGKSTGVWEVERDDFEFELHPIPKDYRKVRKIMLTKDISMDKQIEQFEEYFKVMVKRDDAPLTEDENNALDIFAASNAMNLFEEAMIIFKLTTKDQRDEIKQNRIDALKKKIEND